jgi:hypothetical protein
MAGCWGGAEGEGRNLTSDHWSMCYWDHFDYKKLRASLEKSKRHNFKKPRSSVLTGCVQNHGVMISGRENKEYGLSGRAKNTDYGNTMPFQAADSAERAERHGERIHAGLCRLRVGRKYIGELSDAQIQGGGQPFSVEPQLQMCRTCSTYAPGRNIMYRIGQ